MSRHARTEPGSLRRSWWSGSSVVLEITSSGEWPADWRAGAELCERVLGRAKNPLTEVQSPLDVAAETPPERKRIGWFALAAIGLVAILWILRRDADR
jgi:hypothetical protein